MKATQPLPDEELARRHDPRRLIVFGIITFFVAILLSWTPYTVRSTLIIVYISALMAMGISPLVGMIERQRVIPIGGRLPRWLAILIIYATVIGAVVGVFVLVWPPLVARPKSCGGCCPERSNRPGGARPDGDHQAPIYDRRDRAAGAARR